MCVIGPDPYAKQLTLGFDVLDFARREGKVWEREGNGVPGGCSSPAEGPTKAWPRAALGATGPARRKAGRAGEGGEVKVGARFRDLLL